MVEGKKWLEHALQQSNESKYYRKFYNGIGNNEKSIIAYSYHMVRFMKFCVEKNYTQTEKDYDLLISKNQDEITDILQEYVFELNGKVLASTIKTMLSGAELFFEMNRKIWHKKLVRKSIHKDTLISGGKNPATNEDAYNLLSSSVLLVEKALLHFLLSTGVRPGAIEDPILRKKHLVEMPNDCVAITVYDESKEGYWAFLTPEAYTALKKYFQFRESNGEHLNDKSPIFLNIEKKPMASHSIRKIIYKLIKKANIQRTKTGNRYDKAVVYMFRKRFNTILKLENSVNSNVAEKLMAHKRGLDGVYLQPTREECFREFKKAITALTVDPTERQKLKIQRKDNEIKDLQLKNAEIDELKKNQDEIMHVLDLIKKYSKL